MKLKLAIFVNFDAKSCKITENPRRSSRTKQHMPDVSMGWTHLDKGI